MDEKKKEKENENNQEEKKNERIVVNLDCDKGEDPVKAAQKAIEEKMRQSGASEEEIQKVLSEAEKTIKMIQDLENKNGNIQVNKKARFITKLLMFLLTLFVDAFLFLAISGYSVLIKRSWVVLVDNAYLHILIFSMVYTIITYLFKYLIMNYFPNVILKTFGLILIFFNVLTFIGLIVALPNVNCVSPVRGGIVYILFYVFRMIILSMLYSKLFGVKRIKVIRNKEE